MLMIIIVVIVSLVIGLAWPKMNRASWMLLLGSIAVAIGLFVIRGHN